MATGFSVMDALNKNSKAGDDAQNQTGDGRGHFNFQDVPKQTQFLRFGRY